MHLLHQMQHASGAPEVRPSGSYEFGVRVALVLSSYRVDRSAVRGSCLGVSSGVGGRGGEGGAWVVMSS